MDKCDVLLSSSASSDFFLVFVRIYLVLNLNINSTKLSTVSGYLDSHLTTE